MAVNNQNGASGAGLASRIERSCTIVASSFTIRHCRKVRLISGERRSFKMNDTGTEMHVPYPPVTAGWCLTTWTCGIALQCSPSKQRIRHFTLQALTGRQATALSLVEGAVALGWIGSRWPGLLPEMKRLMPDLEPLDGDMEGSEILERAMQLAKSKQELVPHPVLGQLPIGLVSKSGILAALRRAQARAPWSINKRYISPGYESIPAGGESNIKSSRQPQASNPEEDDIEIRPDQRAGIPYPEWNMWTDKFLANHVAVLERKVPMAKKPAKPVSANVRRWFEEHTHRVMKNRLEDGSDLDIDQYISYHINTLIGTQSDARIFRDLQPAFRDVTTALLLDGSASLSVGHGGAFQLELACADDLCRAMALAKERHGLFVFNGKTRHRVDVTCLRDFSDSLSVSPSEMGIKTGGYTRLGAPIRHLTNRLLDQPSERRLLIIIGDGLISDEGYEGRYAWADSAHAVQEAEEAGISLFYIGVGHATVDPLPDVFGERKSTRIKQVEELPRILARVHRELIAA